MKDGAPPETEATPARRSQARGRERRQALLAAASQLLGERELDQISLQDLAESAGIPTGSAYHFYANAGDAFAALTEAIGADLADRLSSPMNPGLGTWEDVLAECGSRAVAFYAERPDARQLLIGPKAPPELKRSDRENDLLLGQILADHIATLFELPPLEHAAETFFHAVEIIDLFYMLSMMRHGEITEAMAAEAVLASTAYLRSYLPAHLPRRDGS